MAVGSNQMTDLARLQDHRKVCGCPPVLDRGHETLLAMHGLAVFDSLPLFVTSLRGSTARYTTLLETAGQVLLTKAHSLNIFSI